MKIKICGIKDVESAQTVEKYHADFLGFIFYPKSHRYIDINDAEKILNSIDRTNLKIVGVFVNESIDIVNSIANKLQLDFVQLHGTEDEDYTRQVNSKIIKAFRVGDNFEIDRANKFPCELVLIDTFIRGSAGGTGKSFDWINTDVKDLNKNFLVAGGISIDNFQTVADIFQSKSNKFYGLDVSGSLEVDRKKSPKLIKEFLELIHSE